MTPLEEIQELKKRIASLEFDLSLGQSLSQPKKWEPKGGEYHVISTGEAPRSKSGKASRLFGAERPTKELAERAAKEMRIHNRLLAYRDEFCPEYEPDWRDETDKFTLRYSHVNKKWVVDVYTHVQTIGAIYFPIDVARELCNKLNSGEVEL